MALALLAATAETPASSCAEPVCIVAEVKPNLINWNGRVVRLRGWVQGCHGKFSCQIGPSRDAEHQQTLTIDFDPKLERKLGRFDGRQVVLVARVTDECAGDNICIDRGPELIPISVDAAR